MDITNYIRAYDKIREASNILLATHSRPDPDALASLCALAELLEISNKKFFAYCLDLPPKYTYFLPQIEKISNDKSQFNFDDFDLIIALDCGSLSRTNLETEIKNRKKTQFVIEFDHHPKMEIYSDLAIKDEKKSSTTEVLFHFFKFNKIKISKNIATCLLTGLLGDTGNFLYSSASNQTMQIAAEMLKHGARMTQINKSIMRNKSLTGMKIWGQALNNLEINPKYNLAFSVLTYEDVKRKDFTEDEFEGIAGFLSNLYGINALLFLQEEEPSIIRGSFRSVNDNIDIAKLAAFLGGGGHPKAAGFKIEGRIVKTDKSWKIE